MGSHGVHVRVRPEVEELVRQVAQELGYLPHAVRNTAMLYGLAYLLVVRRVPENDREFLELLGKVRGFLGKETQKAEKTWGRYIRKRRRK